jgi:uncharacterized protein (DUF2384 family)
LRDEDPWGSAYRARVAFLAQTFLVSLLVRRKAFSEERAARTWAVLLVLNKAAEIFVRSKAVYLFVNVPISVVGASLLDTALKGLYTHATARGKPQ